MTEKNKKKIENKKNRGSWFGVDVHQRIIPNKKKENSKKNCRKRVDF